MNEHFDRQAENAVRQPPNFRAVCSISMYKMASYDTCLDTPNFDADFDFYTLLTDLADNESSNLLAQQASVDSASMLTLPWAPILPYSQSPAPDSGYNYQEQLLPTSQQYSPTEQPCLQSETVDTSGKKQLRASKASGSSKKGPGKRSEAWILKNRRAQQKFRAKQKVRFGLWSCIGQCSLSCIKHCTSNKIFFAGTKV